MNTAVSLCPISSGLLYGMSSLISAVNDDKEVRSCLPIHPMMRFMPWVRNGYIISFIIPFIDYLF